MEIMWTLRGLCKTERVPGGTGEGEPGKPVLTGVSRFIYSMPRYGRTNRKKEGMLPYAFNCKIGWSKRCIYIYIYKEIEKQKLRMP